MMLKILKANPEDNQILTEITKKSKAHWGYSDEQMEKWSKDLTVSKDYIKKSEIYKLSLNSKIIAYYSYCIIDQNTVKLDNLFVVPEEIGKGYGKILMNDLINKNKKEKTAKIILEADPNAEKFYESFGFVKISQVETSIKNRFLPVMELEL
ncbi:MULTISPECIES: GNAT family N-acetyltransferase [Chryseobacterium]|uniref:Ribosomal-protein-alanine N-acetyltransferase n=1 Tax=Chryseobacterium taihuense TaxID=1141221 RepID=A0A4U8W8L0_9FLAO|nr:MULTISPECIES: GNAT family N-acetyltransferase [Chryseobacterium]QQV04172.1 GNAT family N-acetyltransferase [Chryseobacterium sp. FDAARGOS 1104]VFB02462.1 ribosomal-protein-alanine N-acetyltransferase [Chryseobacterium taihuense]